jgi:hypothetical protein
LVVINQNNWFITTNTVLKEPIQARENVRLLIANNCRKLIWLMPKTDVAE